MKKNINILVFPASTEIGLEINKSLIDVKNITLFGASSEESNHAKYVFENYLSLPNIKNTTFIKELNNAIKKYDIKYIYPAHDDVILYLSENRELINAKIVCSSKNVCKIARSKKQTYEKLKNIIDIPHVYHSIDDVKEYPVFVKPDIGQGSYGAKIVYDKKQLQNSLDEDKTILILEYLSGEEYTVDCFCANGKILYASGRNRIRTKNGISMNSSMILNDQFLEIAEKINGVLRFNGAWFFQVKYSKDGILKLLEIAPRIAGTMCISRARGVNLPLLSIYEQENENVELLINNLHIEVDRALTNKYKFTLEYDTVYIDYDDTLICKKKVNTKLISFIFQCINENKKIILITRHKKKDIEKNMIKYRVNNIFDEVIVVNNNEKKSKFINNTRSIFIDDSFAERKDVCENLHINTFDCNQIELLTNGKNI